MKITLAQKLDIEEIKQIDHIALKEKARCEFIEKAVCENRAYIFSIDAKIIGYGVLKDDFFGHPFIEMLYFQKLHRGRGYGPLLLKELEKHVSSDRIFTSTNQSNRHMQHVLDKEGWEKSGFIDNLDEGDPELVYCKKLI